MEAQSFLEQPYTMASGDAAEAIETAAHSVSGRMYVGGQEHFYLEAQAAMAVPGEDDDVTVYSSTQHPSEIQHKVAHVLGVGSARGRRARRHDRESGQPGHRHGVLAGAAVGAPEAVLVLLAREEREAAFDGRAGVAGDHRRLNGHHRVLTESLRGQHRQRQE